MSTRAAAINRAVICIDRVSESTRVADDSAINGDAEDVHQTVFEILHGEIIFTQEGRIVDAQVWRIRIEDEGGGSSVSGLPRQEATCQCRHTQYCY